MPADTALEAQDYTIPDGVGTRQLKFRGIQLATVNSERPTAPRWTVLTLYKTISGVYVVHRIGLSRVFHTASCSQAVQNRLPYGHESKVPLPKPSELSACPQCNPRLSDEFTNLRFEQPRNLANVLDGADAVVDSLHRSDRGARNLPWLASALLNEAARLDKDIADSYSVVSI